MLECGRAWAVTDQGKLSLTEGHRKRRRPYGAAGGSGGKMVTVLGWPTMARQQAA